MIEIFEFDEVAFQEWWMNESWIICMKYWVRLVIKSCLKNREHQITKYEIQLYKVLWNIFWEYEFFFNCIFKQTDQSNQSKPNRLVWFGFFFEKQWKPNQSKSMKVSSVQTFFWLKTNPNRTVTPLTTNVK